MKIVDTSLQEFYCRLICKEMAFVNDPRNPLYTVDRIHLKTIRSTKISTTKQLNNMVGGHAPRVLYVNLPIDELKKAALSPNWKKVTGCGLDAM